jgi:hypothetical protein
MREQRRDQRLAWAVDKSRGLLTGPSPPPCFALRVTQVEFANAKQGALRSAEREGGQLGYVGKDCSARFKVPNREKGDLLALLGPAKPHIVAH